VHLGLFQRLAHLDHLGVEIHPVPAQRQYLTEPHQMRDKIRHAHTDVADELRDWETEDLHRKRAHLKRRHTDASTIIRAHSWWETKGRRKVARRLIRKGRYIPCWSTRPPLRPSLHAEFIARMIELLHTKLTWRHDE
jgi:hypothetical protein